MHSITHLRSGGTLPLRAALFVCGLASLTVAAPQEAGPGGPAKPPDTPPARLTFEQTLGGRGGVRFSASAPKVRWAADGEHVVRTQGGKRTRIEPRGGEASEMPPAEPRKAPHAALRPGFEKVSGLEGRRASQALRGLQNSKDGKTRLVLAGGQLYVHRAKAGWSRLTEGETRREMPSLAPGGRHVVFREGHDLHILDITDGVGRKLTLDGTEDRLYGKLDWVYQEEVYGRGRWNAKWWSPDSQRVAFLRVDQSAEPRVPIVDNRSTHPTKIEQRYPKAGDPNPKTGLGIANVDGGVRWVDLSKYGDEALVVRVGWTPDGSQVVAQVQDRIQTWLDLLLIDPATGKYKRLLRETSPTWVNILGPPRWLADGSFLWMSERTGHRHLYHYDPDGGVLAAVTRGDWDVSTALRIDEKTKTVWFTGTRESPIESHAYRVGFDGTGLVHLTPGEGSHQVTLNKSGTMLIDRWSSVSTPTSVRVLDRDGKVLQDFGTAAVPALQKYAFSAPELHRVKARDGVELDVQLVRPQDFDPTQSYPVWLPTYSGPNAKSVRNQWSGDAWTQFLAQQGCIVMKVNVRSASGRGQKSTGTCYRQLGVQELADLEDAVRWLTAHPWADGKRVGITGWSYGGFMAAFALTHSDLFRLGIAGAGVYDWHNYDSIYTERYMRTPKQNPKGYAATSCVKAAKNLKGHLVLVHGTQDDNVHVANAHQMAYALQQAGKQFDLMLYPGSGHGLRTRQQRRHNKEMVWRTIQAHLLD